MSTIHPTAIVHPDADIAADVEIGPYSIVEADVTIGAGCVLREQVIVRAHTTLGKGNFIDAHTVLGGEPQDLRWHRELVTGLRIGDDNVFREGVTISRASIAGHHTVVGSDTYWMNGSHAAHDATIHDRVVLCNGALVAGHATVGPRAFLSGHVMIHQFTRVGEGVMSRGHAGVGMHVPPFTLFAQENRIAGLNVVGMRRAGLSDQERREIKEAFRLTYRASLSPAKALEEMDRHDEWCAPAGKFRQFVRDVIAAEAPFNRGLCPFRKRAE